MVSILDRVIGYGSIMALYSAGFIYYTSNRKSFNDTLFEKIQKNANHYIKEKNDPNIKIALTKNKKILFFLGVENNFDGLKKLRDLNELTQNFTFDHMIYEKNINK
jgi:hypothetical protein